MVSSNSPKKTNERIRFSSKNEFVRLFFGRIGGYQKSFRNYLTFKNLYLSLVNSTRNWPHCSNLFLLVLLLFRRISFSLHQLWHHDHLANHGGRADEFRKNRENACPPAKPGGNTIFITSGARRKPRATTLKNKECCSKIY